MTALCAEDLQRAEAYSANAARSVARSQFASYGDYLDSLAMTAEIADIKPVYLERIAQLVNKTNQFNLTNRRYAAADIRHMATDPDCVVLYGRLADAFGDNGLVSVVIARQQNEVAHIDLWIMSCRVLKRDMELAMLDALVARCRSRGVRRLRGRYDRSPRNGMVADHYRNLGFVADPSGDNGQDHSSWLLDLAAYSPRNTHIKVSTPWTEAASSGS
jgi:FkbH-like protein